MKTNLTKAVSLWMLAAALTLGVPGCEDAQRAADCNEICVRYRDCLDPNYDVETCRRRCRANADVDRDYQSTLDHCVACINDRACSGATVLCWAECAAIVP